MEQPERTAESPRESNPWTASDIKSVLHERGWLSGEASAGHSAWCERAASLLGPHAADRAALAALLQLIFQYDAVELVGQVESHVALSRYAARDVLREAGRLLLDRGMLDSEGFKEIITQLKERLELTGREILMPIRLALAGRLGEGDLDRIILLLDHAAVLAWTVPVKDTRKRIVEFCAALD
jgi:anticodon-binding protein